MVLFVFGTDAASHAQDIEWETLNDEVLSLDRQGLYDRAIVVAKKALQVAVHADGPNHLNVAQSLNILALLYCNRGQYVDAEPLFKRSLAIRERNLGPDHPDIATSLNNLALLYCNQGQYAIAEPLFKRSLVIMDKTLGPDHPDVAIILNNLARLYVDQGEYTQADPLYKRSLAIMEKTLGPDHPDIATILENMAVLYRNTGREKAADEFENRAASIRNTEMKLDQEKDDNSITEDNLPGDDPLSAPASSVTVKNIFIVPRSSAEKGKPVGAPKLKVGDSYTFEVENTSDRKLSYVVTRKITAINGNRMTVEATVDKDGSKRSTYYDRAWGYLGSKSGGNDGVSFSPALKYFDFPLSVGKKWTAHSTETNEKTRHKRHHTISGTVEGWEKVQVPAGDFEALRVFLKTEVKEGDKVSAGTDISWYVPALHRSVKTELTGLDPATGGEEKKIIRLLSYQIQRQENNSPPKKGRPHEPFRK
jgi:tetratricopeptide (TPR) repeat protein